MKSNHINIDKSLFEIGIGTMLGDGYAEKRGLKTRLTWHHGPLQKEYLA